MTEPDPIETIKAVGSALVKLAPAIGLASKVLPRITRVVHRRLNQILETTLWDGQRMELLKGLVGTTGFAHLYPGTRYIESLQREPDQSFHPNEIEALTAYALLFPQENLSITPEPWFREKCVEVDGIVCAGGPQSNERTAAYLPHRYAGESEHPTSIWLPPGAVPYQYLVGNREPGVKVFSRRLGGFSVSRENAVLIHGEKRLTEWRPTLWRDATGWLGRDFLLVSKLPRNIHGGEVILVAGGHGAGTRAFQLLFDPAGGLALSDLKKLAVDLKGARYWQFVLEAEDINHSNDGSVAKKLLISQELPPIRIEPSELLFQKLRSVSSTSSPMVLRGVPSHRGKPRKRPPGGGRKKH